MNYVTLEYNAEEKTFAAWGFSLESATCQHVSLAASVYRVSRADSARADDPIIPYEGKVIIRRDRVSADASTNSFSAGYVAFVGYSVMTTVDGRPEYGGKHFTFANAWKFLEETTYQQRTSSWSGEGSPTAAYPLTTDITLFQRVVENAPGVSSYQTVEINSGEQIRDLLQHVLDYPPTADATPFEIGIIDPDLPLGSYPINEITVAAAIIKCLELSPDVTSHFDYSTTPVTIHFRAKANRVPVTLAIANGSDHQSLQITPREDLVPACVIIYWRIIYANELINTLISYVKDKWGPNGANSDLDPDAGPGVVLQTFNLSGSTFTRLRAYLRTRVCHANTGTTSDADRRDWWAEHVRAFDDDARITALTIENSTFKDEATGVVTASPPYGNEMLDSVIASWMTFDTFEVSQKTVRVDARASFTVNDTAAIGGAAMAHKKIKDQPISTRIVLTNGSTGWYQLLSATVGDEEDAKAGLARKIYESLALQYEGKHVLVEPQITSQITLANTLCLSGGRSEWETMEAHLQSITEEEGRGVTEVSFGPAKHLSAGDLRALQLFNRLRANREPTKTQRSGGVIE